MIDHIGIPVSNVERSKRFYEAALSPLGYELLMQPAPFAAGFGHAGKPDFRIAQNESGTTVHVAFSSPDRATVDTFHDVALAAGGEDNGRPGLRSAYHPHYHGAFVLDPDGNNVEAVCHTPE